MLKTTSFLSAAGFICALLAGPCFRLAAQNRGTHPPLEFKQGQRIVFLGSSLFENELENGYLEFAMTSRWPDLDLTFRNLGWTGDNVYAEGRSTFTSPPGPYQQLFQQIRSTRPDWVLIAYGGVESQQGKEGLGGFVNGLGALIDSVDALGAQTILLSTIPVKLAGTPENTAVQNSNLRLYADAIASVASKRKKRYVDIYTPLAGNTNALYLDNGIHLNGAGYQYLARVLEEAFGWPPRESRVTINAGDSTASGPAEIISGTQGKIVFSVEEPVLPFPVTGGVKPGAKAAVSVQVNGLKEGRYTLTENGRNPVTATGAEWAEGVALDGETSQKQAAEVRDCIVRKNALFFQQYRPRNRTYILGFRSYEQGNNKRDLDDMDPLIAGLEAQIKQHRKPAVRTYELSAGSASGNR